MDPTNFKRKVCAILVADVVGSSKHMQRDEAGTLKRFESIDSDLIQPRIRSHRGRIFNRAGDNWLAEFGSVVDAVQCAVALQSEMARRDLDLPEDRRIKVRIGLNLGDVILRGKHLYGDGVNIAAHLEKLAAPGGITVSGTAFDHLHGKLDRQMDYHGEVHVKDVPHPVRVYTLRLDGAARPSLVLQPTARPGSRSNTLLLATLLFVTAAAAVAIYLIMFRVVEVSGYIGGSKANLLDEPEVVRVLRDEYRLRVKYKILGGREQVCAVPKPYDYLWPGTELSVEEYKECHGGRATSESLLSSPVVMYSWGPVIEALNRAGVVERKPDGVAYANMKKFVPILLAGKMRWPEDVGGSGHIVAFTSDPTKSNSGQVFAAILAKFGQQQYGGSVGETLPIVKRYFDSLGYMPPKTSDLFRQCLGQSMRACPIFVGYESLWLDFLSEFGLQCKNLKSLQAIYSDPTVWATHPLIAATPNGEKLLQALGDAKIQKIAVEKHGFRTMVGETYASGCIQSPPSLDFDVMRLPAKAEMEILLRHLEGRD